MTETVMTAGGFAQAGYLSWCFPDYKILGGYGAASTTIVGNLSWDDSPWRPYSATWDKSTKSGKVIAYRNINDAPPLKSGEEYIMGVGIQYWRLG